MLFAFDTLKQLLNWFLQRFRKQHLRIAITIFVILRTSLSL